MLLFEEETSVAYKPITVSIIKTIRQIPKGAVATYGEIADRAGYPGSARQVARVLSALSAKENLPWQRVVNSHWKVSLKGQGGCEQRRLLREEGVIFQDEVVLESGRWYGRLCDTEED